jgi:hypothetical protein
MVPAFCKRCAMTAGTSMRSTAACSLAPDGAAQLGCANQMRKLAQRDDVMARCLAWLACVSGGISSSIPVDIGFDAPGRLRIPAGPSLACRHCRSFRSELRARGRFSEALAVTSGCQAASAARAIDSSKWRLAPSRA